VQGNYGALISLNCETDFVAKNENFIAFSHSILDLALAKKPANLEALLALPMGGKTVAEVITEQSGTIGEKLELAYFDFIQAEKVQAYNHFGNNLATLVGFNKAEVADQVARDVAMQIAAMSPVSVDKDDVPAEVIEKERKIGREKALEEGKPENIVDRIAEGMVSKFLKENTLLNQEFTKDSKKTVGQYIKESDKDLKVTGFKRFSVK
jgi:elongation factor Ts